MSTATENTKRRWWHWNKEHSKENPEVSKGQQWRKRQWWSPHLWKAQRPKDHSVVDDRNTLTTATHRTRSERWPRHKDRSDSRTTVWKIISSQRQQRLKKHSHYNHSDTATTVTQNTIRKRHRCDRKCRRPQQLKPHRRRPQQCRSQRQKAHSDSVKISTKTTGTMKTATQYTLRRIWHLNKVHSKEYP